MKDMCKFTVNKERRTIKMKLTKGTMNSEKITLEVNIFDKEDVSDEQLIRFTNNHLLEEVDEYHVELRKYTPTISDYIVTGDDINGVIKTVHYVKGEQLK